MSRPIGRPRLFGTWFTLIAACVSMQPAMGAGAEAVKTEPDPLHAWVQGDDPAQLEAWVDAHLAKSAARIADLVAVKGPRTIENALQPYDDAQSELAIAGAQANLLFSVGATAALRDKAQALSNKIASAATALSLDPGVYRALVAVPLPADDAPTRYYLQRTLLEYRLAGVDKDESTRKRVQQLQDRITTLSLAFNRALEESVLTVAATRAELDGLPADTIARFQPDAEGKVTITTNEPDVLPVLNFASSADLRRRVFLAYENRGYPQNKQVLLDLLATRYELATTLGFGNFADLAVADQMIGSSANIRKLFADIDAASRGTMQREYQELLEHARRSVPGITELPESDRSYWSEQYRRSHYAFDAQSVRPYFPYENVERGILDAAGRIFHVSFRRVEAARTWHPSVKTFDVVDAGRTVGRIYLDMHPREGKDKWYSSSPVVPGIRGKQIPEGMLTCNFPGGEPSDPGLMQYQEVVTFFHEFGHLMHHVLGSQNRWSGQGGFNVEGDFLEAPSQMLEEFFTSHNVLAPIAHHFRSGVAMPQDLFRRMMVADTFGRGLWGQRQLVYATFALEIHDRPPAQIDLDTQWRVVRKKFSPFSIADGDHFYTAFPQLTGYASNQYTYLLDKAIAIDFYAQFDRSQPLVGPATERYRRAVIDPGATKPAVELVRDFLGRTQSMDAFRDWVNVEFQ